MRYKYHREPIAGTMPKGWEARAHVVRSRSRNTVARQQTLGTPVVPDYPSCFGVSLLKLNTRKKGIYPYYYGVTGKPRTTYFGWIPHPVIVSIRDNKDHIRVVLYSYYTTIAGWGVLLRNTVAQDSKQPRPSNYRVFQSK